MNARAPQCPWRRQRNRGFSLIEVLITTAVTVIAFTGLATVQILSLRAAASTLQRSQATTLAYDMVDRLRLNRGESGMSGTALGGGYDEFTLCDDPQAQPPRCDVNSRTAMTTTDRAALDLREWWSTLYVSGLPNWFAGIQRDDATFTITVQWDDGRSGDAAGSERQSCIGTTITASVQEVCVVTQL